MSESQKILAFDIGIRNLAWCLLDIPQPTLQVRPEILGWQNYDLLPGQGHEQAPKKLAWFS